MHFSDAVRESPDGVVIDLEVTPGTHTIKVPSGYNHWRKRIEVKLTQSAHKGKANKQLITELSKILTIRIADITLVSGHSSHKKSVHIRGLHKVHIIDAFDPLIEKD